MSDPINRADVIATIGVMYERCDTYDIADYRDLMLETVKVLPSADRWVPCSERLPKGDGCDAVLASVCSDDAIYDVVFILARDVEPNYEKGWVNAWMPSPQPWKGADDE